MPSNHFLKYPTRWIRAALRFAHQCEDTKTKAFLFFGLKTFDSAWITHVRLPGRGQCQWQRPSAQQSVASEQPALSRHCVYW